MTQVKKNEVALKVGIMYKSRSLLHFFGSVPATFSQPNYSPAAQMLDLLWQKQFLEILQKD